MYTIKGGNLLQLLAMLTMVIDHIGKVFFENQIGWRIIGRIAFPIYSYLIVRGYKVTKNRSKYVIRLLIIALLSQYPYMYGLDERTGINVVGSFVICLLCMIIIDKSNRKYIVGLTVLAAGFALEFFHFDYGLYGMLLVFIYRYAPNNKMILFHFILNVVFLFYKGWLIQFLSIVPTIAILYMPYVLKWIEKIRIPRWFWRSFYPAHLGVIAIILYFLTR